MSGDYRQMFWLQIYNFILLRPLWTILEHGHKIKQTEWQVKKNNIVANFIYKLGPNSRLASQYKKKVTVFISQSLTHQLV